MNELVISNEQQYLTPVTNVHGALQRYQDMKDFVTGILRVNIDFGVIPGTTKNTLLKPGAEKLTAFFGLAITYEVMEKIMDWSGAEHGGEPFFYFAYKVRLMRSGLVAGEGEGSCNSWEKKYRYRKGERKCPKCEQPTIIKGKDEYGGGWLCYAKKGGCGAKFKDGDKSIEGQSVADVPNADIADQVNTIQKMAQKRALVAATLNTVNASDWFTQDVEDFIDGGFEEAAPVVQSGKPLKPVAEVYFEDLPQRAIVIDEPQPTLVDSDLITLEMACKMTNSSGVQYGTMPANVLEKIISNLYKTLNTPGLADEDKTVAERKVAAAKIVYDAKNSGEIK